MRNEPINSELSSQQLETELKRIEKRRSRTSVLKNAVCWLFILIALAATVSALWFPIFLVTDLSEVDAGDQIAVLTMRTQDFLPDDQVVWRKGDAAVLQSVVAVANDRIEFDDHGLFTVNGQQKYEAMVPETVSAVPEGCVLLTDSLNTCITCVSNDEIAGKVVVQLWPLS